MTVVGQQSTEGLMQRSMRLLSLVLMHESVS